MSTICDDLRAAILQAAMQGKITDSKIDDNTLRPLWSVTYWDKKFKEVSREKQPRTISYHHVLANFFKDVEDKDGDVFLLSTGSYEGYTTEEKAGEHLCEGEVVTIPWGGKPTIKYYKGKFVTSDNRIATSRDTKILDNRFLYYFMLSRYDYINDSYRGAALKHPEMKLILDMEIPVFPIDEQRLIVQKLDELMARVADLEKSADALASLKKAFPDDIKASLLQYAMQGKLTKQLPEDGSTKELFERVTKKILPTIPEEETPFTIPESWEWIKLETIASIQTGHKDANYGTKDGAYPFYTCSKEPINSPSYSFDGNYLILPGNGANVGLSIHYIGKFEAYQRTYVVGLLNNTYPVSMDYLQIAMEWNWKQYNADKMYGSAIPYIKLGNLKNYIFPLPPLAEQKRVVERLESLMQNINAVGDLIASE